MTPLVLIIENYGSFTKPQLFHFPTKPGLYFMWGRNQTEPRLQANGAGKSTVWNAFCWLFHGRNTKGLKASDVANWGVGKGTKVQFIYLDSNGAPCRVTRTWSPNSFTYECSDVYEGEWTGNATVVDLDKATANPVMDALRLDFAAFTQTIVMPQGSELFMELKHDAQTTLFSDVMGLDRWIKYSERASARARTEDMEVRKLERDVSTISGRLSAAREVNVDEEFNRFEDDRTAALNRIEDQMYELSSATVDPDRELKWAGEKAEGARAAWRQAKENLEIVERGRDAWLRDRTEVGAELKALRSELDRTRTGQAEAAKWKKCPVCYQSMEGGGGLSLRGHCHEEVTRLSSLVQELEVRVSGIDAAVELAADNLQKHRQKLFKAEDELDAAEDAVKAAQRFKAEHSAAWDRLDREEAEWKNKLNPHKRVRDELRTTILNLEADHKHVAKALNQAETAFSAATAWVRGFKEIRLAQIQDALDQLSIEVNNQVVANGLVDWELTFGIDRESKGGSITRGFSIMVYSPHNKKPVPWKAWSGGETQRLIVSGQAGFANLVRAHTGTELNLEVWDEPTTGMSEQGVKDLLDSLHERAHAEGRQIWVVDHHTLGYNKFDGACGVIKGDKGSFFKEGFPQV